MSRPAVSAVYKRFRDAVRAETPAALATVVDSPADGPADGPPDGPIGGPAVGRTMLLVADGAGEPETHGDLGNAELTRVVARDALGMLDAGLSEMRHYGPNGEARRQEVSVFVQCHARRPQMVIFGAVDFTRALAAQAKLLGYRVTVCDAREVFATRRRFPMADEVVVDWPNRLLERIGDELGPRDAVCVLTHDAKFDVPAVVGSLPTRVGYLGAMGSRKTHAKRVERLRAEGVTDDELARIKAPIGLDIGGRTPEETAVSVMAEIIALRTGRAAPNLADGEGRIH
ncbi:MAG TPA: sulfurylase large subunit [Acidimicrobiaceae bacterium]|nr:sulfurylase large subunit [Acidimicrobiaceae bacterium]